VRLTTRRFGDIGPVREKGCLNFLFANLRRTLADGSTKLASKWFSWDRAIDQTLSALAGKADTANSQTDTLNSAAPKVV
jgi:hypothetical protein